MMCPSDSELVRLCQGQLAEPMMSRLESHLDSCEACRSLVVELMKAYSGARIDESEPLPMHSAAQQTRKVDATSRTVGRRYQLLESIGQGGMGQVFLALDRLTGQQVALKRVCLRASAHALFLAHEFRTLATLRHPNIISVLDYGFDGDHGPFFTMELLANARPILPSMATAPLYLRIELLMELLQALSYLHRRCILHGDIKPSNILVPGEPDSPSVRLLDFGLAQNLDECASVHLAGTPSYMAPERFRGAAQSVASDLYSVGVLAFELLTGQHPFGPLQTPSELLSAVLHKRPALSLLPPELRSLFARVLSKTPEERPATAMTLAHALADATWQKRPREAAVMRDSCLFAARFIGRQAELQTLRTALAQCQQGHGAAVLVRGESGAGKSRLLEELRSFALVDGVLVVRGQAVPSRGTAYHLWRDVLRVLALHVELDDLQARVLATVLPDLCQLLDRPIGTTPDLELSALRFRLLTVLREVIERVPQPVLVLLEDLQWADAESLALLSLISEDIGSLPLLLLATCRDEEAPRPPAQLPVLPTIRIDRLDRPAVQQLSQSLLGARGNSPQLMDLLMRETEGNAFFVLEVLRALAEESGSIDEINLRKLPERILPGGMASVLVRRLAWLSAEARTFIRFAAVAGRYLDLPLCERETPQLQSLVQECAEAGVLEMHEQQWRFCHDKLRDCVMRELDEAPRKRLHVQVAQHLQNIHPDHSAHAARIAYHYREADELQLAVHYYTLAGEAALRRGTPAEAESDLGEARLMQQRMHAELRDRVRVLRGLAQAQFGLGKMAEAASSLRLVCDLLGKPLPTDAAGWLKAVIRQAAEQVAHKTGLDPYWGFILMNMERQDPAWVLRHELLAALSVQEVFVWLDEPHLSLLCTLWGMNLEHKMAHEHERERTSFGTALAFLLSFTPLRSLGVRYLSHHRLPPNVGAEIDQLRVMALVAISEGRWDDAAMSARHAVTRARAQRDDVSLMYSLLPLVLAQSGLDDYSAVMTISREMETLATRIHNPRYVVIAHSWQGAAWLRAGEFDRAEAKVQTAREVLPPEFGPVPEALILGLSALVAARKQQFRQAKEWAQKTLHSIERARFLMVDLRHPLCSVLDVLLSLPKRDGDEQMSRFALTRLRKIAQLFPIARANYHLYAGRHAWAHGQRLRAVLHLRRSLHAAMIMAQKYDQAHAHHWLGVVAFDPLCRLLMQKHADEQLPAALHLFEQLGAPWEAARTRDELHSRDRIQRNLGY